VILISYNLFSGLIAIGLNRYAVFA
jgi:hypothetical protein